MFNLANGRKLPSLLFVTSLDALNQLGWTPAEFESDIKKFDSAHRVALHDRTSSTPFAAITEAFANPPAGVVVVGGYDTVPARRVDTIGPALRTKPGMNPSADPDHYFAWNDDHYGDINGDGLPELPVSRVPSYPNDLRATSDPVNADFVVKQLEARDSKTGTNWRSVRGSQLTWVSTLYAAASAVAPNGSALAMRTSPAAAKLKVPDLVADNLYLVLHCDFPFPTQLKGDLDSATGVQPITVASGDIANGASLGRVVFTGACHGGLIVSRLAHRVATIGKPFDPHTPSKAIALAFLRHGLTAFTGSTTLAYVPSASPFTYCSQPLHKLFWSIYNNGGLSPANSLYKAKMAFLAGIPHVKSAKDMDEPHITANELKLFWSSTCLGLGW